jgi:hypothetical protein
MTSNSDEFQVSPLQQQPVVGLTGTLVMRQERDSESSSGTTDSTLMQIEACM